MSTTLEETVTTETTTQTPDTYSVQFSAVDGNYRVFRNGVFLTDRHGMVRVFTSANSARKRIARERSGNFHK